MDPNADAHIAAAPMPTSKTLKARSNVFFQIFRFAAINLKMIRVIVRGHG
jgi:hypothetical protein